MDLLKSEFEIRRLGGLVPMKTDFLLTQHFLAFVGSHLFLSAVVTGALILFPLWQGADDDFCRVYWDEQKGGSWSTLEAQLPWAHPGPL